MGKIKEARVRINNMTLNIFIKYEVYKKFGEED